MTVGVDFFEFLMRQKPVCTQSPVKTFLGAELHSKLRAKCKAEYGLDLLDDACDASKTCQISNKGCIGRPLPNYPEIIDSLTHLQLEYKLDTYKDQECLLVFSRIECDSCPFRSECTTPCPSQESYLRRHTSLSTEPRENTLVPYEYYDQGSFKALTEYDIQMCSVGDWINEEIPYDCLTERQYECIKMSVDRNMTALQISQVLGIGRKRVYKHIQAAKSKLKEYGLARKHISQEYRTPSFIVDYYVENMTQKDIAIKYNISQSTVNRTINKWKSLYSL